MRSPTGRTPNRVAFQHFYGSRCTRPLLHFRALENADYHDLEERVLNHLDREVADMMEITPTTP